MACSSRSGRSTADVDLLLRVAPEVRLRCSPLGLRAHVDSAVDPVGALAGASSGTPGIGSAASPSTPVPAGVAQLERRSLAAQQEGDIAGLRSVEEALTSLHRQTHQSRRRPEHQTAVDVSPRERAALRRAAFRAALREVPFFKRSARAQARQVAESEAETYALTVDVAQAVITQHRGAVLDDGWNRLSGHDVGSVVSELDAAFATTDPSCTCVDAGWDADATRGYVTVVARYPGLDVVADRGPGVSSSGRAMLRRRTKAERNAIYLSGLASFSLATARHAISVAVAADDVQLVIVRPIEGGDGLEPIYVGSLSREAVTLRPASADPVPLFLGAALRQLRFEGPSHDLLALEPADDVTEVIARCLSAEAGSAIDEAFAGVLASAAQDASG